MSIMDPNHHVQSSPYVVTSSSIQFAYTRSKLVAMFKRFSITHLGLPDFSESIMEYWIRIMEIHICHLFLWLSTGLL